MAGFRATMAELALPMTGAVLHLTDRVRLGEYRSDRATSHIEFVKASAEFKLEMIYGIARQNDPAKWRFKDGERLGGALRRSCRQ